MENTKLEKAQAIASIVSAIAIPLAIACAGWWVQATLKSEDIKKDYVKMALGILQAEEQHKNQDLRGWAVAVLDANAPVPFSKDLKEKLGAGEIDMHFFFPMPPKSLLQPPGSLKTIDKLGPVPAGEVLMAVTENYATCHKNAARLELLQDWALQMQSISMGISHDQP
tara:strand:+ start:298 stop:801 length:504 start_codon:yes stop_codon:yes gene_type:complete